MTRVTPQGTHYVFFRDEVIGPKWVRLDTEKHPQQVKDVEFFKSEKAFEVVEGWPADGKPEPEPSALDIVSDVVEKVTKKSKKGGS